MRQHRDRDPRVLSCIDHITHVTAKQHRTTNLNGDSTFEALIQGSQGVNTDDKRLTHMQVLPHPSASRDSSCAEIFAVRRRLPAVSIETAVGTSTGRRPTNQDRVYADSSTIALFDGVGGMAFGDVAASVALAEVLKRVAIDGLTGGIDIASVMRAADDSVQAVGASIGVHIATTAVVGILEQTSEGLAVRLGWAGDSTALLVRAQGVLALTTAGASSHGAKETGITNWLGNGEHLPPRNATFELMAGDTIVLLSDGVTGVLPAAAIGWLVSASTSPRQAVERILAAAETKGATDNCSVVIANIQSSQREEINHPPTPIVMTGTTPPPKNTFPTPNVPRNEDLIRTVEDNASV